MPNAFGEPLPDQTGELRLQLMQARDQRDAFKALAHRDVLAVIREAALEAKQETNIHDSGKNTFASTAAVIANLEREASMYRFDIEQLKKDNHQLSCLHRVVDELTVKASKLEQENARLKADVRELIDEASTTSCINALLIKAGTAMGMVLPDTDEANAAYRAFEYAAKGGQS